MVAERVRWRNVREFLDDLPARHCTSKPPHDFCTICMRINYLIAQDCPLFHVRPKRRIRPITEEERPEPLKECVTSEDVQHVLEGEDYPIIEFAGPRGSYTSKVCAAEEEDVYEVEAIEVTPIEEETPKTKKEKGAEAAARPTKKEDKAKVTASSSKVDPDELMHRIMEELDIKDEEEPEEDTEEAEAPEEKEEEPKAPKEEEEEPEAPEEKEEEPEAPKEEEEEPEAPKEKEEEPEAKGKKAPKDSPPVVEKKVIRRRKVKGED